MSEQFEKNTPVTASAPEEGLELGLQELEALEAPGFWTGFSAGTAISGAAIASAAIAT
ncbi:MULTISPECIES: daptide-type RiPP [unclassified Streptomyces]|uniref:daptide-type RiPP n=1 Tax=unclassified Streptomyces TaxID=2593676 RepID=UPI00131BF7DD|nr:daptide-type RiPP [Streptomyces sp. NRRL S-87]